MQLNSSVGRASSIYLGSKLLTKIVSFALIPVWTFVFSPTQYGIIGNLMAWAGFLSPLIMIGLPSATLRLKGDCADEEQWSNFVGSIALILLGMSAIFLLVSWVAGPSLWSLLTSGEIPYWPLVPITLIAVALGALARLALVVHQAEQSPGKVMAYEQALSTGVIVCALLGVFAFHGGVTGYMLGGLAGAASVSIFFGVNLWQRRYGFSFQRGLAADAVRYGLPLVPQAVAAWTLNLSDRVMLERFSGLEEAGFYNLAANFGIVISMVAISLDQAILPKYLQNAGDKSRIASVRKLSVAGLVVLTVITSLSVAGGPLLLSWMINSRYGGSLPAVCPILMGCFFFGVYQFFLRPLILVRRTKLIACLTVAGAMLNLIANYLLIPKYGAMGAAWTTLGSYFMTASCAVVFSRRHDQMGLTLSEITYFFFAVILVFLVSLSWPGNQVGEVITRGGAALISSLITIKVFWKSLK